MADMRALLITAETHPLQLQDLPGPKGPYDITRMKSGFFVRLDMPGVPPNGIKIFKRPEKKMVTFNATAPKKEGFPYDESERVYAGVVQLNKDPNELLVDVIAENGSVILLFPTADGHLFFIPQSRSHTTAMGEGSSGKSIDQAQGSEKSEQDEGSAEKYMDKAEGSAKSGSGETASNESTEDESAPLETSPTEQSTHEVPEIAIGSTTEDNFGHINKLKIKGPDGVCEKKVVQEDGQYALYVRADLPGLEPDLNVMTIEDRFILVFGPPQTRERYMQGARNYLFFVQLRCSCCKFNNLRQDYEDGVLRLFCKIIAPEPSPAADLSLI
ncbi:hypothetical protein Cgig2_018560 [Carnegiea gigantea]|uniref:SHSP domain-containing protein n=1 Tax=Carnegiea gigantea TaxID=171969 RepID=A0A9Q1QKZ8_9CARY|nr:hypothetical protein Cgig2_018560 [Carnegiea gigantea]